MAGNEDQVAAPQVARIDVGFGAERRKLKIAVARQLDAGGAPCALDKPRTVDALCGASAPHISGADQRLGHRGRVGFDGVDLDERGQGQEAVRSEEHPSELQAPMRTSY